MTAGGTPRRCTAVPRAGHHAAGLVGTLADTASFCHGVVSVHRVGNVPATDAARSSCLANGAVVRTDTDKNAALCSAPSTSPMTRTTMKLSRIIPEQKERDDCYYRLRPRMRRASLCHVATRSRPSSMNCLTVAIAMGASGQTHIPVTRRIRIRRIRSTGYGEWLRISQSDDLSNRSRSNGCRRKNRRRPGRRAATTVGDAIVRISAAPGSAVQRGGSAT